MTLIGSQAMVGRRAAPRSLVVHRDRIRSGLVLAALGVSTAAMHYRAASPSVGPVVVADEYGYLGSARYLAGAGDSIDASGTPFYSPGFSVLAAIPARLFRGDPSATYQWTIVLNAILTAAALILAAVLAARLMRTSLVVTSAGAFVAGMLPALRFNSSVAMAEPWLTLLVPISIGSVALIAADVGRSDRVRNGIAVASGLALGWLPLSHNRLAPVAAVLGAAIVVNLGVRRAWARLAAFAAGAVAMAAVWQVLVRQTRRAVWRDADDVHTGAVLRTALTTRRGLWETAQVLVGQSWSLVVGTVGFAALAVVALVQVAARSDGATPAGTRAAMSDLARSPRRLTALSALAALFAELGVSAAFTAGGFVTDGGLPEFFVYGRYVDIFGPLLMATATAAATATVFQRRTGTISLVTVGSVFAALVVLGLAADAISDDEFANGWFNPFSAMNVASFGTDIARGTWSTAAVMAVTLAMAVVGWAVVNRWSTALVRGLVTAAVVVPAASALDDRGDDMAWLVNQLRASGEPARSMSARIEALEPSEVWLDGSLPLGDRLVIEWWTPTLRTERANAGCPPGASTDALLVYAANERRVGEVAREGQFGVIACG